MSGVIATPLATTIARNFGIVFIKAICALLGPKPEVPFFNDLNVTRWRFCSPPPTSPVEIHQHSIRFLRAAPRRPGPARLQTFFALPRAGSIREPAIRDRSPDRPAFAGLPHRRETSRL